ncbi:MAG: hypothetical protein NC225_10650 [Clostridium sp.]|nr:hypothetical protein [Clostridium sp.]MCM1460727.1 hypothetical protein [Bacteroides sp.]
MNDDLSDALVKQFKEIQAEAIRAGKKMYDAVVDKLSYINIIPITNILLHKTNILIV